MFLGMFISLLFLCPVAHGQQATALLPPEWQGVWVGKLAITDSADKSSAVAVALKIEHIKGTGEMTWAITYGEGDKAVVRDYKLQPDGDKPGRFRIDERNGTVLDARLVNGVLYSQFAVGGALLTARYEIHGDTLRFEVTSSKPAPQKTANGNVQGYVVEIVQTAVPKRKGSLQSAEAEPKSKPPEVKYTEMILIYNHVMFPDEFKQLDGVWNVESLHMQGKHFGPRDLEGSALPDKVIFTSKAPLDAEKRCDIYAIQIDPKTSPKRLIATVTGGEIKGWRMLGIYKLEGKRLEIQLSAFGDEVFPKQFGPTNDDWFMKLTRSEQR
jgi:uncharacterized protein (TIGR03067 family)